MSKTRYLSKSIEDDLKSKMVFLSGPRQVGKTTLALKLLGAENEKHPAYLNWDSIKNRKQIIQGEIPDSEKLIVIDGSAEKLSLRYSIPENKQEAVLEEGRGNSKGL